LLGALSSGANVRDALNAATEAAGFSGRQNAERATQEADQKERLRKEAEKLAEIEEKIAKTGKEALIETDEQRLAFLKEEVQAARDAMQAETDRVKRAEKRLGLEKAQVKVQEQQKKIAADAAELHVERMDRVVEFLKRRKAVGETIAARMKYTEEEFANANLRGISDPETRRQVQIYQRDVMGLRRKRDAASAAGRFDEKVRLETEAQKLMAGLDRLQGSNEAAQLVELKQQSEELKKLASAVENGAYITKMLMAK